MEIRRTCFGLDYRRRYPWWCLLGRGAEFVLDTFVRRPRPATLFPPNAEKR
jgi:hypothetical protein